MGIIAAQDTEQIRSQVVALIEPLVCERKAELVDVELMGPESNRTVRIFVYRPEGVTVDLCADLSREIGDLFDLEDPLPGRYRLEVTSPGLDRPLRTDRDFTRGLQRRLKIVLSDGSNFMGRLDGFDAETLQIETAKGPKAINRGAVAKATIEAEI